DVNSETAPTLILIDEILRGTNTTERLIVSEEILAYFSKRNALVIAATHDLELVDKLSGIYESFHFDVTASGDDLNFDYRLRPGTATSQTAIALLEHLKFPPEITANSRRRYRDLIADRDGISPDSAPVRGDSA